MSPTHYLTAYQANQETQKTRYKMMENQKNKVFSDIEEAVKEGCFSIKYYMDLFPETKQTLIDYGYGVVCPDDGGKCWEISWDSGVTPQLLNRR